jgi:UDP-GlcNAc:undecaprenyl-phosphate GlcNAc-1-phosphate transferase
VAPDSSLTRTVLARVATIALAVIVLAPPTREWLDGHQKRWLYLAGSSLVLALVLVPVVRACARWAGVLDQPSARKVHQVPTPLLGGAAVYAAFAITVLANFSFSRELKGVAVGGAVVVALGIVDDVIDLPAWVKLAGQLAATALAMAYGAMLTVVPQAVPGAAVLNAAVTVLWFLTVTNAVQFLDGMDGLAAGLGALAAAFFSVVALQTDQPYLVFLSASLMGACLGFLPYNLRRGGATIFLGDSGASFIGFTLAGLAVMGVWSESNPLVALLTPVLILAVPLFDIAFVGIVRVTSGKVHSVHEWLAYTGKDHIHHRLEQLGFTKRETVLVIYFLCATLGMSATLLKTSTAREAGLIVMQAACVLAIVALLEGVGRGRPGGA